MHSPIWVQNHDFVPTILGGLGIEHEPLDGSNVWSQAINQSNQHNYDYVITGWGPNVCVRDQDYSVHLCTTGYDREMRVYDLQSDSEETENISDQSPKIIQEAISRVEKLTGPLPITFGQYKQKSSARSMRTYTLQQRKG